MMSVGRRNLDKMKSAGRLSLDPSKNIKSAGRHGAGRKSDTSADITTRWTFLSFNSRSLYNKLEELDSLLTDLSPPPTFIRVQETWCIPSEPDSLYNLVGYLTFRRDRPNRLGGGVLIYVRAEAVADVTRQPNLETENEDLWLK